MSAYNLLGPKGETFAEVGQGGPWVLVYYPYRKTPHLYVSLKGHPIFCTQCNQQIPKTQRRSVRQSRRLWRHIAGHHRRAKALLAWDEREHGRAPA